MSKAKDRSLFKDSLQTAKLRTPTNMNGHQFVATGTTFYRTGELKEVAFFAIDADHDLVPEISPLCLEVRSAHLSIDNGIDRETVADVVSTWLHRMKLPLGKKIVPLVWDEWVVRSELTNMLDTDMDDLFHEWRCLKAITRFMNDVAVERGETVPYPKSKFISTAQRILGHDFVEESKNDAPYRALVLAKCYSHILKQGYKL